VPWHNKSHGQASHFHYAKRASGSWLDATPNETKLGFHVYGSQVPFLHLINEQNVPSDFGEARSLEAENTGMGRNSHLGMIRERWWTVFS